MPIVLAHVSQLPFSFSSFTDFIYLPIPSFVFPHLDIFFPPNGLFFHSLTHTESTGLAIKVSKNTINMNPLAFRLVCAHMCVCVCVCSLYCLCFHLLKLFGEVGGSILK